MPIKDKAEYNAYMRDYMTKRYARRRAAAVLQLGGACVVCGSTESLEFDHIEPTTKERPIQFASLSEAKLQIELAKCQLLCHRHHQEKSRTDISEWAAARR